MWKTLASCACLSLVLLVSAKQVQVAPMNLALNLRVAPTKEEWQRTETEVKKLLAFAKENKFATNVMLMLQGVTTKVEQTGKDMVRAIDDKAATDAKHKALAHSTFTAPDVAVKPLKKFLAAKKDIGVPRFTVRQFMDKVSKKKIDWSKPFLISNGVTDLTAMQEKFTSKNLMKPEFAHIRVRYITPLEAKKQRSFDRKADPSQEEQLQAHMISFEKFFVNCFNFKGKKDFLKSPGANTEHCENTIEAATLDKDISSYQLEVLQNINWGAELEAAKSEFLTTHQESIKAVIPDGVDPISLGGESSRQFVFGPSGSGEQIQYTERAAMDGLLHGRRRWLFLETKHFQTLRQKAGEDMEPASAFVFFENQLGELKEDFNLGRNRLPYMECNQEIGDLLFVPKDIFKVSLSLQDSASYSQKILTSPSDAISIVNSQILDTSSGSLPASFRAFACFDFNAENMNKIDIRIQPGMQLTIIQQIMKQNFGSPQATNMLIVEMFAHCKSLANSKGLQALLKDTLCSKIWDSCAKTLRDNAKKLKASPPAFLKTGLKSEL